MVSDVCELNIPEVKLFFRFCEHRDSDVLPVGMKFAKAIFSTSVGQFVIHNWCDKTDLLSGSVCLEGELQASLATAAAAAAVKC